MSIEVVALIRERVQRINAMDCDGERQRAAESDMMTDVLRMIADLGGEAGELAEAALGSTVMPWSPHSDGYRPDGVRWEDDQ